MTATWDGPATSPATVPAPPWRVHLPSVTETTVRVSLGARRREDPWPFTRALHELTLLGVERAGRTHALGTGRGVPLEAACDLAWRGHALRLETLHHVRSGTGEAALEAPPWDDLVAGEPTEDAWWDLVDRFCAAVEAHHGALTDGEAIDLDAPSPDRAEEWGRRSARHVALLLPAGAVPGVAGAPARGPARYHDLPHSGLVVLLR